MLHDCLFYITHTYTPYVHYRKNSGSRDQRLCPRRAVPGLSHNRRRRGRAPPVQVPRLPGDRLGLLPVRRRHNRRSVRPHGGALRYRHAHRSILRSRAANSGRYRCSTQRQQQRSFEQRGCRAGRRAGLRALHVQVERHR
ncbi:unnamed protein product [Trichogramma brassicae]|uniref:Uncharacterized protein n=1 Tax=Trichogramma brassicae TaxID=86971 RepID=A0A6H5J5H6_9HYME|nr:unnamed protein product [Trichogramma brassicae]